MKKLLVLLLFPFAVLAQKTDATLSASATAIKNSTSQNSITPTIIGNMFLDIIRNKPNKIYAYTATEPVTDDYRISVEPTIVAITSGQWYIVVFPTGNAGAATLTVNSTGAKDLLAANGSTLSGGEILDGESKIVVYNGTGYQLIGGGTTGGGVVNSVFGRTGTVTAQSGDYTFSQLSATPTTRSGYGITDAVSNVLSPGNLLVGNGSGIATGVPMSGDATLSSAGSISVNKILGNTIPSNASGVLTNDGSGNLSWGAGGGGGSGTVTSIATTSPITGGTITATGTIGISDAAADGSTKGAATFTAADFNASSGLISIDYTNGQAANGSTKGFLTAADWNTFNGKQAAGSYLVATNNLSDITSASTARSNLGLGTLATQSGTFSGTHSGTSSGTNTGDQTTISGNAGTATALQTGRTISISGDLLYTSPSFDGTGNVTAGGTLATVNSNVGTFGSATKSTTVTANGKGLITAISEQTVTPAVGSITGLGTGVATALGVNIGSAGAVVVNGGALGTPSSGTLTNATGLPPTTGIVGWPSNSSGVLTNNGSGTLSWAAGGGTGTVTTVSVATANGFAGSVANATTTPAITVSTSVNGMAKGNGTALSAATDGTDYLSPSTIGYSTTSNNVNILGQTSKSTQLGANGNVFQTINTNGLFTFSSGTVDSSTPTFFTASPGSYTNITASTENPDFNLDMGRDVQWATGNFNKQRFFKFGENAPTMSAIGASTIKYASTVSIPGAPVAGSNMTITNPISLWSQSGYIESEDEGSNNDRNLVLSRYTADANATRLTFKKSRGTIYSPATVATSDVMAQISIAGYDGTQYTYRNPISWTVAGTVSSGFLGMDMVFKGDISGTGDTEFARFRNYGAAIFGNYNTLTEIFRLTNAGTNVFPNLTIDTGTSTGNGIGFSFDSNNGFVFTQGNATRKIGSGKIQLINKTTTAGSEAAGLGFFTQSSGATPVQKLTLLPAGGVGIQNTAPTSVLQVSGSYTGPASNGWTTTGIQASFDAATYTDPQAGNQTRTTATAVSIGQPTFANSGSATITATDASTFYIANAPTSSNVSTGTFTNTRAWAMTVAAGNSTFGGKIYVGATNTVPSEQLEVNGNAKANNHINAFSTTATAAGTTTLTVSSNYFQTFTGSTTQTVTLPVATTLYNGFSFRIVNTSSGVVTVQTSGSNTIKALAANSYIDVWVINTAGGTGTASWNWIYTAAINN